MNHAQSSFLDYYLAHHCNHDPANPSHHLTEEHLTDILTGIREAFSQHQHPALIKTQYKYYNPEVDYTQNQTWKQETHGFDQVNVLEWVVNSCSATCLSKHLSQLIPPLLLVLDDYDIDYKVRGVQLLHQIVDALDDKTLTRSGVENVFIQTLFKCLTYVSEDRHLILLQKAYPCIVDLISKTKAGKKRAELFEKVMVDGILLGLKLGRNTPTHQQVLLAQLSRVYSELGVLGVQYLGVTIAALCHALSVPLVQLNKVAITSLQTVIEVCWPRIPRFHGVILTGLATSWQHYYSEKPSKEEFEMCHLLKEAFKLYRAACKGTEITDLDALLAYNRPVYLALIN